MENGVSEVFCNFLLLIYCEGLCIGPLLGRATNTTCNYLRVLVGMIIIIIILHARVWYGVGTGTKPQTWDMTQKCSKIDPSKNPTKKGVYV